PQRRVAPGDHVEHQEDGDRDREEHRHQADQPPEDDAQHQPLILSRACGSSASRSASPSTFSATTVSRIAIPGATVSAGAATFVWYPWSMMSPHLGARIGTPPPRNESAASVGMLLATITVRNTSTIECRLGNSSDAMMRNVPAPFASAAWMNSIRRSESTWPR